MIIYKMIYNFTYFQANLIEINIYKEIIILKQ